MHACILKPTSNIALATCLNRTINGDSLEILDLLPPQSVDLIIVDPPYNMTKNYNGSRFARRSDDIYEDWLRKWLSLAKKVMKKNATIYICSEWRSSNAVQKIAEEFFIIQNRITWEREKGRGAKNNWKNASEDIWFCTVSDDYYFNVEAVKMKKKVIAPYRDKDGKPKDWQTNDGENMRLTHPSNLWNDISVPFWSMPENTEHPTQKPEKLIAKLMLASSKQGDVVLDPFLGSGTTSVVAKKLGRNYIGIEKEIKYCLLAEKRLKMAEDDKKIQGYFDGYFWERNSLGSKSLRV